MLEDTPIQPPRRGSSATLPSSLLESIFPALVASESSFLKKISISLPIPEFPGSLTLRLGRHDDPVGTGLPRLLAGSAFTRAKHAGNMVGVSTTVEVVPLPEQVKTLVQLSLPQGFVVVAPVSTDVHVCTQDGTSEETHLGISGGGGKGGPGGVGGAGSFGAGGGPGGADGGRKTGMGGMTMPAAVVEEEVVLGPFG